MYIIEFFDFDTLTWSEVAALPRSTPLIIPIGNGFSMEKLADALGNPPRIGMLPTIPFGWRGSMLAVDEEIFCKCIFNLLNSLFDEGFTQVFTLTPQEVCPSLGSRRIVQAIKHRLTPSPHFSAENNPKKVVLVPIGHTEQHACHLPLNTDTVIIEAIAKGVQDAAPDRAVSLPVMPYGVSTHRAAFAGTMNMGGRAFEDFWLAIVDSLISRGFMRVYFMSGHGGNCSFLTNVVKYAGERYTRAFIATSWLYLSGPKGVESITRNRNSPVGGMGHAGELETSLMLHLRPDLVHMDRVMDEMSFIATESYYMDWVEGGALIANPPWEDDTITGAYGAGSLGTAEKGAIWLKDAIQEKTGHIDEIHQQILLRANRRAGRGQ